MLNDNGKVFATHLRTLAGIIWDSGAASIVDCHVFVVFGLTQPISNSHSSNMRPLNRICNTTAKTIMKLSPDNT